MSFQRMLMMAAREPRPYLPHPEDLICLYVPRWQTEQGNTLIDFGGMGINMVSTRALTWTADGVMQPSGNSLVGLYSVGTIRNYTIIANRDYTMRTLGYGFELRESGSTPVVTMERRRSAMPTGTVECMSLGSSYSSPMALQPDGWTYQRTTDYNGTPISRGSRYNVAQGVACSWSNSAWTTIRVIAAWRIELADEEIEMAKLFLDTATLEDYMMSRL